MEANGRLSLHKIPKGNVDKDKNVYSFKDMLKNYPRKLMSKLIHERILLISSIPAGQRVSQKESLAITLV